MQCLKCPPLLTATLSKPEDCPDSSFQTKRAIFCDAKNISSPPLHLHVTHLIKTLEAAVCNSHSNIKWVEKIFELDVVDEALFHSALMLCDVLSKFHSFFTLLNYDNQLSWHAMQSNQICAFNTRSSTGEKVALVSPLAPSLHALIAKSSLTTLASVHAFNRMGSVGRMI